ncbi:hypothetical protein [Butyrivibrio fibrisolvens]|uniref:hypothetical protein n=1 Tax=Butyrivibrio fibrisolvens TaxID=831 RepID=UPI0020BE967D|nr:hypothetical protein [Butyrivibrio fibrisolvens]
MLMPDSLRQEYMPMMVYYLCKAVDSTVCNEDDLKGKMTAFQDDKNSSDEFNKVFKFSENVFIKKDEKTGEISSVFSSEELKDYKSFSKSLLTKLELKRSNKFSQMLEWLIGSENRKLDKYTRAEDFVPAMGIDGIDHNTVHGFLFWCEMLGIISFNGYRSGRVSYALDSILYDYLEDHEELKQEGYIPAKLFFDKMASELFFIKICIHENNVSYPLSQAIRILEQAKMIKIETMKDIGDVWHLSKSNILLKGNNFTNIKVC